MEETNGVEINAYWRIERGLLIPINEKEEFARVAMLIAFMTSTNENSMSQEALKEEKRKHSEWHKWHEIECAKQRQRIMDHD